MVRVLSCHHFTSQEVFSTKQEPEVIYGSGDKLFIATVHNVVEVYQVNTKECRHLLGFMTVSAIDQLVYSECGKYVATVEVKSSKQRSLTFVRLYFNWEGSDVTQPVRARIAGVPASNSQPENTGKQLEVVELPLRKSATCIQCCAVTGNLAIGIGSVMSLYRLCSKTVQLTETTYTDLDHLLDIHIGFNLAEIALCENYVGGISADEVRVLQVHFKNEVDEDTTNPKELAGEVISRSTTPTDQGADQDDVIVEDEDFVLWSFEEHNIPVDSVHVELPSGTSPLPRRSVSPRLQTNTISLRTISSERPYVEKSSNPTEVLGPVDCVQGRPITVEWAGLYSVGISIKGMNAQLSTTTLLYRRFAPGDTAYTTVDGALHSLQFLPTYSKDGADKSEKSRRHRVSVLPAEGRCSPLHPNPQEGTLHGLCCFFTGPRQGFLYDIFDGANLLASYPYTADTSKVVAGDSLLHAVTRNGLETYTLRKFAAAVHRMEDIDNIHNTCPHPNMDICLIGMRPFIAIQDISVCTSHVLLLSKVESPRTQRVAGQSHWSLYALQNASVGQLYKDMLDLGLRYQNSSPPAYHQLLCEGHLLLRQALFSQEADSRTQQLQDLLCESCGLLGDYHSLPDSQDWTLALPYYNMSGLKVAAIVQQALHQMQPDREQPGYGRGLVHFLDHVLFTGDEPLETDKSTSNIVLEAYSQLEPENLSKVIIKSRLRLFDDQKAVSMLRKIKRGVSGSGGRYHPKPLDVLAMAVLKLRLCEPEQAQIVLSTVTEPQLVQVLLSEHQLLRTESTQLSHLSQLLRRHQPQVLIAALVALQGRGVIAFETALQLLRGSEGEIHQNTHIRDYLEGILQACHSQPAGQKVGTMLCDIYIQRLVEWKPPSSRPMPAPGHVHIPRGGGCFGVRYTWLDHLPPFKGVGSAKQPCQWVQIRVSPPRGSPMQLPATVTPIQVSKASPSVVEEVCMCCCCNEDLLKLQSLLCSGNVSTDISQHVLQAVTEDMKGFLAVKLLCLAKMEPEKAVELMIDSHPSVLVSFGETVFPESQERWIDVLHLLLQMFEDEDSLPDDRHESLTGALQGVLSCLASLMEPQAFINLLPSHGTVDFFLPYIQQCLRKHRAGEMRNRVASGQV
ncbi:Hermansky-Pudlak syndrome 3 protein-like [Branchiostoma floridae]|uniref:Hermansky-Pudlak syndrome 3 protein-like n=1 Tax=Branchiostoma floridae TaxID=7739 RepID=A0A9J7N711_BRAFL|nr:Hermansky-Pudlak syndrome 3 protein-like [Branchiostoma floridae]XP_035692341.1 Hermansky-Pudlak syndrome 3 protein-like [Branchiostoma floridae]XP_035692349.1 Hermansky-Pudlak syndrome 3 protein-like [Branchiostoma floridae]XP_035692359.1 Hermansky-Pudlak syndrome 3 protein-like [Branchiostoma floridae]